MKLPAKKIKAVSEIQGVTAGIAKINPSAEEETFRNPFSSTIAVKNLSGLSLS